MSDSPFYELEAVEKQYVCSRVLADLGNPAGAYVETIYKEPFVASSGAHHDHWRLLVIVPGMARFDVQYLAADLPCIACGLLSPASLLHYGACRDCWSAMPYALSSALGEGNH